ncbi:unnamed protein product [Vitrella brassicaformis CCMP3155]|uniref:Uncharacterized protein n=1 Tax=Vitrella brassicaformis (strain CCMP3155) TaxID=1169540 RepID=A0A0G4GJF1_VITBC|nr:unnamed protein product [Vitrella brassicaformis CCMP3155]|mmetsp:Transcript_5257/g.14468  ORF Transcript_5257/g.14468 Transcript_5257/m.14468 type:complete len:342 (-) Transcript_5257:377-1402(-)|eukprot:CEM30076.1 unnamed protein product [Vitrella brassicaformis CCMP3155]
MHSSAFLVFLLFILPSLPSPASASILTSSNDTSTALRGPRGRGGGHDRHRHKGPQFKCNDIDFGAKRKKTLHGPHTYMNNEYCREIPEGFTCDSIGEEMQIPYPSITRKPYLKGQHYSQGNSHFPLTYHHLVPKHLLVDWWNFAVCSEAGRRELLPLISSIADHAHTYSHQRSVYVDTTDEWKKWVENFPSSGPLPDFEAFWYPFAWMPGDLVRGPPPDRRTADPGSFFDPEVAWYRGCIDGEAVFTYLTAAYDGIQAFCDTKDAPLLAKTAQNMAKVATISGDAAPFRPAVWDQTNAKCWTALGGSKARDLYKRDRAAYCEFYGSVHDTTPYFRKGGQPQ